MYGHSGHGEQIAAADSQYKTGFAYTTNWLSTPITQLSQESKWKPLVRALFQCIYDHEGTQVERQMLDTMEELEREKQNAKAHKSKLWS